MKRIDIIGAESIYCIDKVQLNKAIKLSQGDSPSAEKIQSAKKILETDLSRNELAAPAFLIIDDLRNSN